MKKQRIISYSEYSGKEELSSDEVRLYEAAVEAASTAYAPYSSFSVGAALLLSDGTVVRGSNQENAAYPSGMCAERTALYAAAVTHPSKEVLCLCVVARDGQGRLTEATPCGACLQVMAETRRRQQSPMGVLLYLDGGRFRRFDDIDALLPFGFSLP